MYRPVSSNISITPKSRPQSAYSTRPGFTENQRLPSREDLERYQYGYLTSKAPVNGVSQPPAHTIRSSSADRTNHNFTLKQVRQGLNTGQMWYKPAQQIKLGKKNFSGRFGARPDINTWRRLFPTQDSEQIRTFYIEKDTFNQNDKSVQAQTAFSTFWNKSTNKAQRFPSNHPEYMQQLIKHHHKPDRVTTYSEEMYKIDSIFVQKRSGPKFK